MNQTLGVIPARMSSSRFPNKPLEKILGIPMLAHCYERALLSQVCDHLVVATPDQEIINWANEYKVPVLLTSHDHERATDRVAEVIDILETEGQFFQNIVEFFVFKNTSVFLKKYFKNRANFCVLGRVLLKP